MDAETGDGSQSQDQSLPLLSNTEIPEAVRNQIQTAISQILENAANLANLLPTGTVLAFHLLSPFLTNQGSCDSVSKAMTAALLALCGVLCIIICFTDSIKDSKGNLCYGFATFSGLWLIDASTTLPAEVNDKYKLKFIDFMHAAMSALVFAAVALFDEKTVSCFFPDPSLEIQEVLTKLPVAIGIFCSIFFVVFPTKRHGIGFPLSSSTT
ncbi:hypothetical protein PIB30_002732 [Stylosanthes scabra]|uniref:Uncharacterized protein n=1 Tax=Stylosanthes scabra TaxID=79078 RepID=A0ABU6S2G8_9FABA|nr:hypothetical protein [Stylosanthes scabra]